MVKSVAFAFLSFVLFVLAHVFIFHSVSIKRKFRAIVGIVIFVAAINCSLFLLLPEFKVGGSLLKITVILNALFLYLFCYYFYFHLIIVMDRSVSVRMLVEIYRAGKGIVNAYFYIGAKGSIIITIESDSGAIGGTYCYM